MTCNASSSAASPPKVGEIPQCPDGILTLTEEAKKRIYAPDGIMTHHHAIQFLSFGPPFEKPFAKPPIFPTSVAFNKRPQVASSPLQSVRPPLSPTPRAPSPIAQEDSIESTSFYTEFDILSGTPQNKESPPRAPSPKTLFPSRAMSPGADSLSSLKSPDFSTDASTEESQDWDDGTVKMSTNLRDGSRRFSLQSIASQCELTLNRRRSSTKSSGRRLATLRSCLGGLNCAKRVQDDTVLETGLKSEEFTAQGSAYSMSFGHDENPLGEQLLTLYEVEEEQDQDDRSMANMPLLSTTAHRGFVFDEYMA